MKGTIDSLRDTYGFIRGENGVGHFFIPSSLDPIQLITFDGLKEGMVVEFDPAVHPKGPRAINVKVLGQSSAALPDEEI